MLGIGWKGLFCLVSLSRIMWVVGVWFFFVYMCIFLVVNREMVNFEIWNVRFGFVVVLFNFLYDCNMYLEGGSCSIFLFFFGFY